MVLIILEKSGIGDFISGILSWPIGIPRILVFGVPDDYKNAEYVSIFKNINQEDIKDYPILKKGLFPYLMMMLKFVIFIIFIGILLEAISIFKILR